MKIIKSSWWIGKVVVCEDDGCGAKMELEKQDAPRKVTEQAHMNEYYTAYYKNVRNAQVTLKLKRNKH